ncbi:Protein of unknown function [Kaistia soli DSM 19436]|uniref:DUF3168 domain-containing protein n=1 Tax=Kaistia soli DSM 19436 TaxID=1122133 RepID=A0A1M4UYL7_9HYPH|nr:DUF3168 domain-containing protein [Kaistia soli]SHE61775.1 Protein of unknown function [Kaistia soli DSM 19436]
MNPSALDLQVAIVARLRADADLLGTLGGPRIHDGAPRGTEFPFVTLGDAGQSDWSDGTTAGGDVSLTLHVWSRQAGKKEAWAIAGILMRLLHDEPLTLADHHLVTLRATFAEVRRDPDGITEHGVVRLAALVEG